MRTLKFFGALHMDENMCGLLVLFHLFYMVNAKALQTYEDGTNNGENYNYIYENSYLTEHPNIHDDLHRRYTDNMMFENRYVPQIDGHPIFIPPSSSNQYETVNTRFYSKKKMLPEYYWSSSLQNVRLLPEQMLNEHIAHISRVPTKSRDLSHKKHFHKSSQEKVNTQIEKSYPLSNKGVKENDYIQKYSYGKKLKETVSKSSKPVSSQIPESNPIKLKSNNIDEPKLQSLGENNIKYDKTAISSDYINRFDSSYDVPAVVEKQYAGHHDINYHYPEVLENLQKTSKIEDYYKPIITERLIKETPIEDYKPIITEKLIKEDPIEDFYDPVLIHDLTVKHLNSVKGIEKDKSAEKFSYPRIESFENEALKRNIVESEFKKEKSHVNSNEQEEIDKPAVDDNYDYDEPHVIEVSKEQSHIKHKVPTETKFIKTKPSHGEILEQISDHLVDSLSEEAKRILKDRPVRVSSEEKYQKYIIDVQSTKPSVGKKYHIPSKFEQKENQIRKYKEPTEIKSFLKKSVAEYDGQYKSEAKQKYNEYREFDAIAEKEQSEESGSLMMENSINHDSIIKKKGDTSYLEGTVTVLSNINYSKPNKKISNKVKGNTKQKIKAKGDSIHKIKGKGDAVHKVKGKGDSVHGIKGDSVHGIKGDSVHGIKGDTVHGIKGDSVHGIKGDSVHGIKGGATHKIKIGHKEQINNYPHLSIESKNFNQGKEILDENDEAILPNVPEIDLDEVKLEDGENVPFEVGSGVIQERDSDPESRNLFFDSGMWSQMINFHTQERSKFKKCITPKNEPGNCMPIQLCPDPNLALNLDDLVKKVCSIDDVFIGICCPEFSAETLKVDWEDFNADTEQEDVEEIKSTVACGQIVSSGEDVLSWPWMAPLISASTRRIFCGGVLINEQYVLTAAHCTTRVPRNQILVILGPINSTQEPRNQEFTVVEIKRHARYNPRTMNNDIALLKLSKPVPMGDFRRFICLPKEIDSYVGKKAIMLGWQGSFAITKNLEFLRVLPKQECRNNLGEDTLCTEPRIEDSLCNLDSGAPLIIQKDGSYEVIGILTWDRNDCDSRFPAIFTNVSSFQKWIEVHSSS